jgi:uncharacterized repeat protein (TIGR03803 family)
MERVANYFEKLSWRNRAYAVFVLCASTAMTLPAQTFTSLFSFESTNGEAPLPALIQGANGDLYGTTYIDEGSVGDSGPPGFGGTVFLLPLSAFASLSTLYTFCSQGGDDCTDGNGPLGALVQIQPDGDLYGTTISGGANESCLPNYIGCGTVFKLTPEGALTTLYSFCSQGGSACTDGAAPWAGLTGATSVTFDGTAATFSVVKPSLITTTVPTGAATGTVKVATPGGTLSSNVRFEVP